MLISNIIPLLAIFKDDVNKEDEEYRFWVLESYFPDGSPTGKFPYEKDCEHYIKIKFKPKSIREIWFGSKLDLPHLQKSLQERVSNEIPIFRSQVGSDIY